MEQILDRYRVGVTWKSFEELRERIVLGNLLFDNKIENCNGGKLLGQRTQIKNRIGCYSRSGFKIRKAVAVQMYELLVPPDRHGYARNAIAVFRVDQVVNDLIYLRFIRPRILIHVKEIEEVIGFFSVHFFRSH